MTYHLNEILAFTKKIALDAGQIIVQIRKEGTLGVNFKGARDLVTAADLKADAYITEKIKKSYPSHAILSEESAPSTLGREDTLNGPLWIIDPIDGTTNYAHGHHMNAVSVAFADKGEILCGIVHAPFINETYSAIKGSGAFCNDEPIRVRNPENLQQTLVATGFPYDRSKLPPVIRRIEAVLLNCRDIRRIGAASLDVCWVAAGKIDAYYEDVKIWDVAAAGLIAREAGAHYDWILPPPPEYVGPKNFFAKGIVVAAPTIAKEFKEILVRATLAQ